ncbi:MAG: fibronectin type III domain-containing protein [Myxococcota bacterium]|nr:fibronectin type III domain-containing protein [Myxococcota bacterium]
MRLALFASLLLALTGCADKTPPSWPSDAELTSTDVTATTATLRWPAATDDDLLVSYRVLQDDVEIATVPAGTQEHALERLEDSTELRFSVQPIDESGNRGEMLHVRVTTADGTAPTWPAGAQLVATPQLAPTGAPDTAAVGAAVEVPAPTVTSTTLTWTAAEDTTGVTAYRLVSGANVVAELGAVTSHELTGAAPEGLAIVALDAAGNESARLVARAPGEAAGEAVADAAPEETSLATEQAGAPIPVAIRPEVRAALKNLRIRPELLKTRASELQLRQGLDLRNPEANRPANAQ